YYPSTEPVLQVEFAFNSYKETKTDRTCTGLTALLTSGTKSAIANSEGGVAPGYCRGARRNSGGWSGWVVTIATGTTRSASGSSIRNARIIPATTNVASVSANCAPMQTRGPTPKGR